MPILWDSKTHAYGPWECGTFTITPLHCKLPPQNFCCFCIKVSKARDGPPSHQSAWQATNFSYTALKHPLVHMKLAIQKIGWKIHENVNTAGMCTELWRREPTCRKPLFRKTGFKVYALENGCTSQRQLPQKRNMRFYSEFYVLASCRHILRRQLNYAEAYFVDWLHSYTVQVEETLFLTLC